MVGSMFEPEVPLILEALRTAIVNDVLHGEIGQCHFLRVLDAGVPDAPTRPDQVWANCPSALLAQFLGGLQLIQADSDHSINFYSTSTSALGFGMPECDRAAVAAGILKCYLNSYLLAPREHPTPRWDTLSLSAIPPAATIDRSTSFIEVGLDLENLPILLGRELLARWKRRSFGDQFQSTGSEEMCQWFQRWIDQPTAVEEVELDLPGLSRWFEHGLNPSQHCEIVTIRSVVDERKSAFIEQLARTLAAANADSAQSVRAPQEKSGLWTRLKSLLGTDAHPPLQGDTTPASVINSKIVKCDDLITFLESWRRC